MPKVPALRRRGSPMVTMRDVARESGFAVATVSIVLNDAPLARYMSKQTKENIKEVARRLGYTPNQLARSLRGTRTRAVGVVVFDITDPFCTLIIRGIESALYDASFTPLFADAHNERTRFERYLEMMLERRIEGLIVVANWLMVDIDVLRHLENYRVPAVTVARELPNALSSVVVDNELGGRMAIEHLYQLGHRDIAVMRGPKALGDGELRWKGIQGFARSVHLGIDPRLVVSMEDWVDPSHGFEAAQKLTEELLRRGRPFTALVAYDDITALGAMRALTSAGIRVPGDCSVIGFDDVAHAAFAVPPLTTIRQPMEVMGATAVKMVIEAIDAGLEKHECITVNRRLSPELVVRQSTAPTHT